MSSRKRWQESFTPARIYKLLTLTQLKMKLALIFLLIFVTVSCLPQRQQKHQKLSWSVMPMSYYSPRFLYHWQNPYNLLDSASAGYVDPLLDSDSDEIFEPEEERSNSKNWQSESQSRAANRYRPMNPMAAYLPKQQRFFFGALNPFASSNGGLFWQTSSTLVTVTTSQTLLTAVISTCIPATQFAAGAANVACARRRRNVAEMIDQLSDNDSESSVSPTQVQKVETTSTPDNFDRDVRQADYQQTISSSKDDDSFVSGNDDGDNIQMTLRRQNRALVVTFTTTTTSFIFSSTVVKKTLNLAVSTGLACLPSGFTVC